MSIESKITVSPPNGRAEYNAKCDEIDNFMNEIDFDEIIHEMELNESI